MPEPLKYTAVAADGRAMSLRELRALCDALAELGLPDTCRPRAVVRAGRIRTLTVTEPAMETTDA